VPHEIMDSVLKALNVGKTNPNFGNFKGEIGIAYFYDMIKYSFIIKAISENPNCFEKTEVGGKN
jgi:hypothetical protein